MNSILKTVLSLNNNIDMETITDKIQSVYDNLDFEKFRTSILLLIDTQNKLNLKLCGDSFLENLITNKNKKIRFGNALLSEAEELLGSTPWKHWKGIDEPINIDNISVELIDFLHFLPSIIKVLEIRGINFSTEDMIKLAWREVNKNTIVNPDNDTIQKEVIKLSSLASIVGGMCNLSEILNPDIPNDLADEIHNEYFTGILTNLLALTLGLTFKLHFSIYNSSIDDIWSLYIIKNTLNSFRKANGYEDGTYDKMWGGIEDNLVATEIMKNNVTFGVSELFKALQDKYDSLKV